MISTSIATATPWAKQRLAASLFLVLGTDMFIVSPLLPQISAGFGVSTGEASVVAWSFSLVYALLSPAVAVISNRFTRRSAMWFGAAVFSVGALGAALMPTLGLVVAGRVVAAVGASIMGPPVWSFAAETAAPQEVGRAVAGVAAIFAVGQIVGVPLGSLIASFASWRWTFLGISVIAAGLAALIGLRLGKEARVPDKVRITAALLNSLGMWRRTDFSFLVTANFFAQGTRYATYTFAGALLFTRFGLDTAQLGLVGMAVGVGSLIGATIGGRLVDRIRLRQGSQPLLNLVCAGLMTCFVVAATAAGNLWLSLIGWILTFAAGSAFVSNGQEMLTRSAGKNRAFALSWNNSALYAGTAVGTFVLGLVPLGEPPFVLLAGGLGTLTILASAVLWRRTDQSKKARSTARFPSPTQVRAADAGNECVTEKEK
jgi:predicted MFS family arabinose efflux permease